MLRRIQILVLNSAAQDGLVYQEAGMTRKNQSGQALISTVLALTVLLGFGGLAIDMGVLRYEKRLQQTAADAAAVAGASNLTHGGVTTGAKSASAANGFTDGVNNVVVTINNPPASGPHSGNGNYVEALVVAVQPTYFMQIFGINSETITARAVATNISGGANSGCLYTLGPPSSSIEGVNINGSAILNAPTCGIVDNGNYNTKGNALIVNASTFGVSGSANVSGPGGTITCTSGTSSCPTYGAPASSDPLSYLSPPAVQSPSFGDVTTSGTQTLQPGTYSSITIGKNSTVTMNPGIYYVDSSGGMTFNGAGTVIGDGVTVYFTNGATINATGGGNKLDIQLSPPTSGPYAGVLFYQDPNDTAAPSLGGDNNSFFKGILYFPKSQLTFFGNNVSYATGIVVADAIALSGNPTVNFQGIAGLPAGVTIVSSATLVE
jgi:Putative Flp pilus-assembly TadE/G-like